MDNQNVKWEDLSRTHKNLLYLTAGLILAALIVIVVAAFSSGGSAEPTSPATASTQEEVKEEPAESEALELEVRKNNFGLTITNKEDAELKNCEVQINPGVLNTGYSTRVDTIDSQGVMMSYNQLTKGGERFNYETTEVERVVVTMCNEDTRIGVYEF